MKLGILETGAPPTSLRERFGAYPEMFRRLLGDADFEYRAFAVSKGELPRAPEDCDGYIVTGSACGVYDPLPWIAQVKGFLNAASGKAALVGICFGHQLMADAFGGEVVKSPRGWGLGEHEYKILAPKPWMDCAAPIRLPASHQDQVTAAPPGAEVMAASDFTPFGALAYPQRRAISLQLHPEFDPAYAIALIEARRGKRYSEDEADRAISSYRGPDDRARVGGWLRNFLTGATS
jgi:GMP synthase-like glutamine amidotransferase